MQLEINTAEGAKFIRMIVASFVRSEEGWL